MPPAFKATNPGSTSFAFRLDSASRATTAPMWGLILPSGPVGFRPICAQVVESW